MGDNIWTISQGSNVTNNDIDNSDINYSGIYVGNQDYVLVKDNTFSNSNCEVEYFIIYVDNRFIGDPGQTIQVPVKVFTNLGNAMYGSVSSNGYESVNLKNGTATFNINLPYEETKFDIIFSYDTVKTNTTVFTVVPIKSISQSDDSDDVTVKVSKLIPCTVIISINGKNYVSQTVNGEAVFKFTDLYNGIYPAIVAYVADEANYDQCELAVIHIKHNPKYEITQNSDVSVDYSANAQYSVRIDKDGNAVGAGEIVTFTFNGKSFNVKTDEKGYATLNIDSNMKVGTYAINAAFNGVKVTNKVKINQIINAPNKNVKKSAKVTKIKISLAKVNGKFLSKKVLKVKFNKKTYKVKTNNNGVATWNVKKSMLKNLKAGKKVKYTVTYGQATLTKNLAIKK